MTVTLGLVSIGGTMRSIADPVTCVPVAQSIDVAMLAEHTAGDRLLLEVRPGGMKYPTADNRLLVGYSLGTP